MNPRLALVTLVALVWGGLFLCGCGNGGIQTGDIFDAVKKGDLKTVKALLKKNPDLVNSTDTYGFTPICYTADDEIVLLLLDYKADINVKSKDDVTPLLVASYRNNRREAEVLLAHGAEINAKNFRGETPLHWAAKLDNADMTEMLLVNKADVNAKDNNGETPLHWAAKSMGEDMMRYGGFSTNDWMSTSNTLDEHLVKVAGSLLANKAEVNAENKKGETPLHLAIGTGEKNMVELLRQHGGHE